LLAICLEIVFADHLTARLDLSFGDLDLSRAVSDITSVGTLFETHHADNKWVAESICGFNA